MPGFRSLGPPVFLGRVPVNKELFTGRVPVNKELITGTLLVNNLFHQLTHFLQPKCESVSVELVHKVNSGDNVVHTCQYVLTLLPSS